MKKYKVTYEGGSYIIKAANELEAVLQVPVAVIMYAAWSIEVTEV